VNTAGRFHKRPIWCALACFLQLILNNLALRETSGAGNFLQPIRKIFRKAHCDCMTHMAKVYSTDHRESSCKISSQPCATPELSYPVPPSLRAGFPLRGAKGSP
jgi:hypothetical protein